MYSIWLNIATIILGICVVIINTSDLNAVETYCEGTGWVPYRDEKCLKLIKDFKTRDQASEVCAQEWIRSDAFTPQLVSIKSVQEQEFLTEFLFDIEAIEGNVWIGARRDNDQKFVWDDGSEVEFANWDHGSPTDERKRGCAVIQSDYSRQFANSSRHLANQFLSIKGKWRDVACGQGNYVLCQKLPRWSFGKLQQTLLDTRKQLVDSNEALSGELGDTKSQLASTQNELSETKIDLSATKSELINLKQSLIPIGFIYTQLPSDKAPSKIWPWMTWTDVSSAYEGVFFRVTGGDAAPFGQVQDDNAPRITKISGKRGGNGPYDIDLPKNDWSDIVYTAGLTGEHGFIKFYTTGGEVRPRNMAIRIWRRTL